MLTSWLVRRSSRSASGPACFSWGSPRLGGTAAADQLDDPRHDRDEPVVVLPNCAEQLDLVLGDELQPFEVVAELVELTQRAVQSALVRDEQRGGDAVELAGGVVLDLAVGRDLALQLDQLLGALVDAAQALEPDGAKHDQQHRRWRETPPAAWSARAPARARPGRRAGRMIRIMARPEAQEVAPELLRIEARAEILHAQDARADRSIEVRKRMVDVAVLRSLRENTP